MKGNTCPHCQETALAWWRKLFYSPLSDGICRACGRSFRLPWTQSLAASVPFLISFALGFFTIDAAMWARVMLIGYAISMTIYVAWVPLVITKRE